MLSHARVEGRPVPGVPPGITLNASRGTLSGKPSATGSFDVMVVVPEGKGHDVAGGAMYALKIGK